MDAPTDGSNDLAQRYQALHEFVEDAERSLDRNTWGYLIGATETETTVARNRQALDMAALRPRVLRNVSTVDASTPFLGHTLALPVALAPVGSLESFHPGGAAEAARGAAAAGVPIIVSSVTQPGLEETAQAAPGPKVFQLYVRGDSEFVDDYARRAIAAGYDAFCITVDTAHYSRRERDIANRFVKPWRVRAQGMNFQAALSWDDVARFKDRHRIPLMLKGIGTGGGRGHRLRARRGVRLRLQPWRAAAGPRPRQLRRAAGGGRGGGAGGPRSWSMAGSAAGPTW